jgi:hypothetical protein
MRFPRTAYAGYGLLLIGLAWLMWRERPTGARAWWLTFVFMTAVIAFGGWLAGVRTGPPSDMPWMNARLMLLKFYPFRLADAVIPLAMAVELGRGLLAARLPVGVRVGLLAVVVLGGLTIVGYRSWDDRQTVFGRPDWPDACRWIRDSTPANALVQTPHQQGTFKWYAGRAEYVNFKDSPQDAAGIVEWNRRLRRLTAWYQQQHDGGYSRDELRALRNETGITHIVTDRLGPFEIPPVYQNATFRVYDLTRLDD